MKAPEWMFGFINPVMRALLRSPLHGIFSNSIMIIGFRGRKSGKSYETPVRYVRMGDSIRCYSSADTLWWRNLRGGAEVMLRVAGQDGRYFATVTENDPEAVSSALTHYFSIYPQDAAYHDVKMRKDGTPDPAMLKTAAEHGIYVDAVPVSETGND
jgi:hypothetical protein